MVLLPSLYPAPLPAQPTLRVGVAAEAPPLAFIDAGVLKGLTVELAQALARALGRTARLEVLARPRLLAALRGGRIDLMLAGLSPAEQQALGLAASSPVLSIGQMALLRAQDLTRFPRTVDLLTTKARVGYERGTAGARLVQEQMPGAERVPLPNAEMGLAALRHGDIDVLIHDATTVWRVAADPAEQQLVARFEPLTDEALAWMLRAEDRALGQAVDAALTELRATGELTRLINRWIGVRVWVEP
jgi:polar amino acid transport system substrate-binding protein